MKKILVSGGAGFIGSRFIQFMLNKYEEINIINFDSLTYAGDLDNCKNFNDNPRYTFINGDIRNYQSIVETFEKYDISGVIHFAAESHVDNSISNPSVFIETNVLGTFNILNVAYDFWMEGPNKYKKKYEHSKFHHISTDEVYGTLGDTGLFTEDTPYAPNSPYSASKASSDMIVRSYVETYGMNCTISNCSNNYGPNQHVEKLIPTIIKNALQGKNIPIYGDGKYIRDWLFVDDHCSAIDLVFHKGEKGHVYNVGGDDEKTNLEIVESICTILDKKYPDRPNHNKLVEFVKDRAGHDRRYAIDSSKIKNTLGWKAITSFDRGIEKTINWYISKLDEFQ